MRHISKWKKGNYQPKWYPNFPENLKANYYFNLDGGLTLTPYCINLAALEIWANDWCLKVLNLKSLDWQAFWESAKEGYFYEEPKTLIEDKEQKMLISVENLMAELQKAISQEEAIDNSIDAMPEPFSRGVYHGYLKGLNHAMRLVIDAECKERK